MMGLHGTSKRQQAAALRIEHYLECPEPDQVVHSTLRVAGWLFARDAQVRSLTVRLGGLERQVARHDLPRPDVAAAYPDCPQASRSGFETHLDVDDPPSGPLRLDVVARLESDEDVVVASRWVRPSAGGPRAGERGARRRGFIREAGTLALAALRERRLPLSPTGWIRSLTDLRRTRATVAPVDDGKPDDLESLYTSDLRVLRHFLEAGLRIAFNPGAPPRISVVLVLFNRAAFTLRCLRSLAGSTLPLEVVIVDNASSDETAALLERVDGSVVVRNGRNEGFLAGVNNGVARSRAPYLLLLNNDAEVLPGSIEVALETLTASPDVGAVGGKLIFMGSGALQEAGSMVFGDGSCSAYGRDDDAGAPMYMFQRDVDFCSGAFLLMSRELFDELGGFDARFAPAYYEDADLCARVWESGRRVVYEPRAIVLHAEFGSAPSRAAAIEMQSARRELFLQKHATWIRRRPAPGGSAELLLRDRQPVWKRVLFLEDRVPHANQGSGFGRSAAMVRSLVDLGCFVTLYPMASAEEEWPAAYDDIARTVEIMSGWGVGSLSRFLRERQGYYDCVLVSRPPNMRTLCDLLDAAPELLGTTPVVYDAEAIWADREIGRLLAAGTPLDTSRAAALVDAELALGRRAAVVFSVSADDCSRFRAAGQRHVVCLSHSVDVQPTVSPFEQREFALFVGSFVGDSPNVDAAEWFVREVLPELRRRTGGAFRITIAGAHSDRMRHLEGPDVGVTGPVGDLRPLYERARLVVAPTRFAAGLPLKVVEAAAYGVPVVCSTLLAGQLRWRHDGDLLAAGDAGAFVDACERLWTQEAVWQAVRNAALARVSQEHSVEAFRESLKRGLSMDLPEYSPHDMR